MTGKAEDRGAIGRVGEPNPYQSPRAQGGAELPTPDHPPKMSRLVVWGFVTVCGGSGIGFWLLLCCCLSLYYQGESLAPFSDPQARAHFLRGLFPATIMGASIAFGMVVWLAKWHRQGVTDYVEYHLSKSLPDEALSDRRRE